MNGTQQLVGAGGIGLVAAEYWFSKDRGTVNAGAFSSKASDDDKAKAHVVVKKIGIELLVVIVLAIIAGLSPTAGKGALAALVALAIVFAIQHYSGN